MNDSSGNHTYFDRWEFCLDQGYVAPVLCHAVHALCFLLGTPALVWCLWISLSGSLSGGVKPTQVFSVNLFAVELVFCVEGLIDGIRCLLIQTVLLRQAIYVLVYLAWTCRPLIQSCICVERYLAVAKPVSFLKYRLLRYRVACSAVAWLLSLAFACSPITSMAYGTHVISSVYCLGVAVISLCCFFILRVLKQPGPGEVEGGRGGEKIQGTTDPHKMRAFGVILTNLVIILASSIPMVVVWTALLSSLDFFCKVFPLLKIVYIFSVVVSPLMHLYREGRMPCRRGPETH